MLFTNHRQITAQKESFSLKICLANQQSVISYRYVHTPFLFYKNSFYKNYEAENRPKIKNFVRITPGSRSRDL